MLMLAGVMGMALVGATVFMGFDGGDEEIDAPAPPGEGGTDDLLDPDDVAGEISEGGDENDYLSGTSGDDQINGYAGDDQLSGGAGHDDLHGADGSDTIDG